jgi:hypothetical protein
MVMKVFGGGEVRVREDERKGWLERKVRDGKDRVTVGWKVSFYGPAPCGLAFSSASTWKQINNPGKNFYSDSLILVPSVLSEDGAQPRELPSL